MKHMFIMLGGQLCEFIEKVLCFKNIGGMVSYFVNNVTCVLETVVQFEPSCPSGQH